ncbi:MAG: rhamnulokinase [Phycisphaera sp.]|nr:rhamnulokinase [Phycisphaera sp.]
MTAQAYLAFDLGAESGRAIVGVLRDDQLSLHEVHRFANLPVQLPSGYHWNLGALWADLVRGLGKAAAFCSEHGYELRSLGVDTWGVDFGLVGRSGQLLGLPFAYRDPRHAKAMAKAHDDYGDEKIYQATGIASWPFNSVYQLLAMQADEPGVLMLADRLLFMPDLLHYFFSGQMTNEASIASTSQMVDPRGITADPSSKTVGSWATKLLDDLHLPRHMLGDIIAPGSKVGSLRKNLADDAGLSAGVAVVAPACHDTASAIASVPFDGKTPACYLSSGTWSLMGVELDEPLINDKARRALYTHERGVAGTIRFLKNIAGLWLVQECKRAFEKQGVTYEYAALTKLAAQSKPFVTLLDPDHAPFLSPGDMPGKIAAFAKKTGQPVPESPGALVRACLETLACAYRVALEDVESLTGKKIEVIHIVGGGCKNELLNQMTADATGRVVIAGPDEATAAGNVLVQALGCQTKEKLSQARAIVSASFEPKRYEPRDKASWDAAFERFLGVKGKG